MSVHSRAANEPDSFCGSPNCKLVGLLFLGNGQLLGWVGDIIYPLQEKVRAFFMDKRRSQLDLPQPVVSYDVFLRHIWFDFEVDLQRD